MRKGFAAALALTLGVGESQALEPPSVPKTEEVADADRDDAIFGDSSELGEGEVDSPIDPDPKSDHDALEDRIATRLDLRQDPLAIGGQALLQLQYSAFDRGQYRDFPVASPNLLDIYFDSRPNDRLRFYARGRVRHDFTRQTADDSALSVRATGTGTLDRSAAQTSVLLDQLWAKFDLGRRVFVTAGRQRIRWGSGRFWNPTDFLNRQFRDPLAVFDERLGVGLVKVHVPIESLGWNLYAVANLEGAQEPENVGGALRAELVLGTNELALSAAGRTGRATQLGVDLTSALGLFDLRGEVAFSHNSSELFLVSANEDNLPGYEAILSAGVPKELLAAPIDRSDEWIVRASAGFEIQLAYDEEDTVFFGGEYFYSSVGQSDASLYPALFAAGAFTPLYTAEHYGALYLFLPSPGPLNDTNWTLSTLGNLSDRSFLSRLDFSVVLHTHATFNLFASTSWGRRGEFNYSLRIDPFTVPDVFLDALEPEQRAAAQAIASGVDIPGPAFNLGAGLRLRF